MQIGGIMQSEIIMIIPPAMWCFAIATIDSTKLDRNSGAAMKMNPRETTTRAVPAIKHEKDQIDGFQSL
jgi:hypothetical protein